MADTQPEPTATMVHHTRGKISETGDQPTLEYIAAE